MTIDIQTLVLVFCGAVVPLIVYLLSRGPALRQLKVTTDAAIVTSATELATTLQGQVEFLTKKVAALEANLATERINYTNQLNVAYAMIAELRTNQDVARSNTAEKGASDRKLG